MSFFASFVDVLGVAAPDHSMVLVAVVEATESGTLLVALVFVGDEES